MSVFVRNKRELVASILETFEETPGRVFYFLRRLFLIGHIMKPTAVCFNHGTIQLTYGIMLAHIAAFTKEILDSHYWSFVWGIAFGSFQRAFSLRKGGLKLSWSDLLHSILGEPVLEVNRYDRAQDECSNKKLSVFLHRIADQNVR